MTTVVLKGYLFITVLQHEKASRWRREVKKMGLNPELINTWHVK